MDLAFTPEQEAFRLRVRSWLEARFPNHRGDPFDPPPDTPEGEAQLRRWEADLHAAGFACVHWPRDYGGQGMTIAEHLIVNEEIGRVGASDGINIIGRELVGPILLRIGTEEQRRRFVPRIAACADVWCQGFSEPGAGSDLSALKTTARKEGDRWIVNGQKTWTSYGAQSQWCILLTRSDPQSARHRGLTLFIMSMASRGVRVSPIRQITGRSDFCETFLDNVEIPAENVIGEVDRGWQAAVGVLGFERATIRLSRQARFLAKLREIADLLRRLGLDGDASFRQRLASAYAKTMVLRLHNLKSVSKVQNDVEIGDESSLIKLTWSELHQEITGLALDVAAEGGAVDDRWLRRSRHAYLHSRAETIFAGTTQIQKNVLAERVLQLPR
jgi:alkylation response protein AidB-like acyl-CoA dehydrogenase